MIFTPYVCNPNRDRIQFTNNASMKKLICALLVTTSLATQAQQPPAQNDEAIKVIEAISLDSIHGKESPAIYLDGKLVHGSVMATLNPHGIDSITVDKGYRDIDGQKYYGAVYISLKKDYFPNLISLTDLKKQYTKLGSQTALFMVDGKAIHDDYDQYKIDKGYILSVTLERVKNPKANLDLTLVKLLTKTPENIKGASQIMIRGNESPLTGTE